MCRPDVAERRANTTSGLSSATRDAAQRLRRQHQVRRLHALGPRPTFEFIDEIAHHHGIGVDIDQRLARYAELDPEVLSALGADRFPALPIRPVPEGNS